MTGLYPTPTRLALLREVADGHVVRSTGIGRRLYDHYRAGHGDGINRRLSARMAELEQASWCELVDETTASGWTAHVWQVTGAGRTVLDPPPRPRVLVRSQYGTPTMEAEVWDATSRPRTVHIVYLANRTGAWVARTRLVDPACTHIPACAWPCPLDDASARARVADIAATAPGYITRTGDH